MRTRSFLTATAAFSAISATHVGNKCCTAFSKDRTLHGKVLYPTSEGYDERIQSIWSLSARQTPWCIVLPESAEDASNVIKIVSENKCPFGIRAGGHGMHRLSNNVQDGITIDFGRMNATSYNVNRDTVSIGPGVISGAAYEAIKEDGVTITAGRVEPVGASGFVAGGGISYHWASQGWGCDNVVNFEIVLANGTIINANEKENRDLWVAQRGSSGNFGLITRFDMRAIPYTNPAIPHIWGGAVSYDYDSKKEEFIDKWINFTHNYATDENSASLFAFTYDSTKDGWVLLGTFYNAANIPDAPVLQPLITIDAQLTNTLRSDTIYNFTVENTPVGEVAYNIWLTSTYNNDARLINYAQDHHPDLVKELRAALPEGAKFISRTTHHAITPSVVSHSNGNNVLGLEKHVANGNVGVLFLIWVELKTAEDEAIAIPIVKAWHDKIQAYGTRLGINWDWEYLNYAHGLQDPIAGYGEENIVKLREASKKYDPDGVFQKLRGSGFKIPF